MLQRYDFERGIELLSGALSSSKKDLEAMFRDWSKDWSKDKWFWTIEKYIRKPDSKFFPKWGLFEEISKGFQATLPLQQSVNPWEPKSQDERDWEQEMDERFNALPGENQKLTLEAIELLAPPYLLGKIFKHWERWMYREYMTAGSMPCINNKWGALAREPCWLLDMFCKSKTGG